MEDRRTVERYGEHFGSPPVLPEEGDARPEGKLTEGWIGFELDEEKGSFSSPQ